MKTEELHQLFLKFPTVCTDTRKIVKDCIYFALKGDNFDGNFFAQEALSKGASHVIIDDKNYRVSDKYILVEDVLDSLQQLATFHRQHCNAKILCLTGSNGKTTTKELINAVLAKKYRTVATLGNLNNHIGVPLTLLSIKQDTEVAIVEMGANHQKEIEFLCTIAQPDFGYITNFGKAHLEGFGGVDGVIKGKSELYDYLLQNKKSVFLNADDPLQLEKLGSYINKYGFSTHKSQYFKIEFLGANPFVTLRVEHITIQSQLIGSYNYSNCAAAILMGKYFNVPVAMIKEAIENYVPRNNRSQIVKKDEFQIIMDAYNANPTSMQAALENFQTMDEGHKIVFLGDMFELGETSSIEHQGIADLADLMNFDEVFLIGKEFFKTKTDSRKFESFDTLSDYLEKNKLSKGSVLIKGSRGMALERILEFL